MAEPTFMDLNQDSSLYDVLELKPDASPQEVREAYLRTKAAYGKDSVALYTLISSEEREQMLNRIEEAYDILSSADRRKDYDRNHGLLEFDESDAPSRVPHNKKIISIDRVPPMESSHNSESLLVAPTTDFTGAGRLPAEPQISGGGGLKVLQGVTDADLFGSSDNYVNQASVNGASVNPISPTASSPGNDFTTAASNANDSSVPSVAIAPELTSPSGPDGGAVAAERKTHPRNVETSLTQEIAQEVEWRGQFLRKVRELRRISIEEMSNITKVSKTYLTAIEEENFPKLPAPVFMRGFVTQIAKVLKLPHDPVAAAYMARYYLARPDKNAK